MKLLWMSNASHVPSGYGNQTNVFTPYLKKQGHEVVAAPFCGFEGSAVTDEHGILNLPRFADHYRNDCIQGDMAFTQADLLITLIDTWVLNPQQYGPLPWVAWAPLDCEPMLPANRRVLPYARWIWAMSKWGKYQLNQVGLGAQTTYVPHGINTDVFRPVDRTVARQKLSRAWGRDVTNAYVVVMNSANKGSPSRKGFDEALQAFKMLTKVRDDAVLYMHCEREGTWSGENLPLLIAMNQIDPNKVIFADQYRYNMGLLSEQYLNDVYNAADIFLHASRGEGFGIPLVEAQAAGCPVIAPRSSAMTELTHDELQVGIRTHIMHTSGARLAVVDTEALGRKLIEISQADAAALRADALWRGQQYDYRLVYQKYMGPALDRIRDEIAATRRKADADAEKRASYASPAPVAVQGNDRDADLQPVERDSVVSGEPATDA